MLAGRSMICLSLYEYHTLKLHSKCANPLRAAAITDAISHLQQVVVRGNHSAESLGR